MTGDFDLDGWSNGLEYALGTSAINAVGDARPAPGMSGGKASLTFQRNLTALDVTYEVRVSSDLSEWQTIASKAGSAAWTMENGVTVNDDGSGTVVVVDSQVIPGGGRRFLRVRTGF